jgi:pimeloyl-ACP methyl ester carboxylesterase
LTEITRHFLACGTRRVHYRRAGSGPPVVMLHGSPGDSQMLEHEIAAAAESFSVFALDTPGFGFSEALPGETLRVRDLAAATAEALGALNLPPCRVYGSHTGAAIAIELGLGWPHLVSGLVMEGLPAFTQDEIDLLFRGYFAPMIPDPLGGHLTSTWMRFRDQFTWFPWPSRDVTRLNPYGRPEPQNIHLWVSMFYRSCRSYGPAYRAASFYGQGALRAAAALRVPAIYTATITDMLHPHLARLPPLQPNQSVLPLPGEAEGKYATLVTYLRQLPSGGETPPPLAETPVGHDPALMFLATPHGRTLLRCYGNPAAPALIIAHDSPGSGLSAESLARQLAEDFYILVPDLPGCGESTAPAGSPSVLRQAAGVLTAIADCLAIPRFAVLGTASGAAVAAQLASIDDGRLHAVLIDNPPSPDAAIADAIAPDLALTPEGSHWITAWLMVRDSQIYAPWFDGSVAAQRHSQGNFDAQWLHDQTCGIMAARTTYHLLPREAWRFDVQAALHQASVPVHILPDGDTARLVSGILNREKANP